MIERLQWPAVSNVRAIMTDRRDGVSEGSYASFNLGMHVGDDLTKVQENRQRLCAELGVRRIAWLRQVHGVEAATIGRFAQSLAIANDDSEAQADAAITRESRVALAVMVADCLPVLLADRKGEVVAVAHAGWRGLKDGVLRAAVRAMGLTPTQITAWLGPRIRPEHYEVDCVVRDSFGASEAAAFAQSRPGHYQMDLAKIASAQLTRLGVGEVVDSRLCVFSDAERFYSYRRERTTGRCAALIWCEPSPRR